MNVVRVLLFLAAKFYWCLQQFNVQNVFLHGDLEEEVYMEPTLGFDDFFGKNKVCRLKKALYKLKHCLRVWFGRFTKVILEMNYKQSQGNHTIFIKHLIIRGVTTLIIYVDDIIVIGDDAEEETC